MNAVRSFGVVVVACISSWLTCQVKSNAPNPTSPGGVTRGTINVILGNENGLVILTDSMLSETTPDRKVHPLPNHPGQKLFRLDSHSVCTLAGFTEAPIPFPGVEHTISAILQRYIAQLADLDSVPLSLTQKRDQLDFILENELSLIADIRNISAEAAAYEFQLTLAGYDADGKARIVWSTLEITPRGQSDWLVSVTDSGEQEVSGRSLTKKIRGVSILAEDIIAHPEGYPSDKAISKYRLSRENGIALSLDELKDLSRALARETSEHYVGVGGDNQVAVLAHDSIIEWNQIAFPPETYRTLRINIVADNIYDPGPAPNVIGPTPGVTNLYIHNDFREKNIVLDGSYFASNAFKRCVIIYNGGRTVFVPSQDTSSSILAIGTSVDQKSDFVSRLIKLPWSKVITTDDALKTPAWSWK